MSSKPPFVVEDLELGPLVMGPVAVDPSVLIGSNVPKADVKSIVGKSGRVKSITVSVDASPASLPVGDRTSESSSALLETSVLMEDPEPAGTLSFVVGPSVLLLTGVFLVTMLSASDLAVVVHASVLLLSEAVVTPGWDCVVETPDSVVGRAVSDGARLLFDEAKKLSVEAWPVSV
jgi:hypothetical protein